MFGFVGNAQEATNENVRLEFAKAMISFNESVKPAFVSGSTFEDFKFKILKDDKGLTKEGENLLKSAHTFLSKRTSNDEILSSGNVKPMMEAFIFVNNYNKNYKSDKGDLVLFGMVDSNDTNLRAIYKECKWYQIGCHLSNAWNWLVDNIDTIIEIVTTYCQLFGC